MRKSRTIPASLAPIAVIPQIIPAGIIAPLRGLGKVLADSSITARWGQGALEALLPHADRTLLGLDRAASH